MTNPEPDVHAVNPYSVLAAGYDVVMEHVDYEGWAAYVHELLQAYHPNPQTILELGCGTGTFALMLAPLGPYQYAGTDASAEMLRVAEAKADLAGLSIPFAVADFTNFRVDPPVDVLLLLYDGLNYLLEPTSIRTLLRCAYEALQPGGLFFFDQSTPANSINNEEYFEDEGAHDLFAYVRHSHYDAEVRLHTTTFEITVDGKTYTEQHLQRAYTLDEVRALIEETGFRCEAAFDGFTDAPATPSSERIHWMLRKPDSA